MKAIVQEETVKALHLYSHEASEDGGARKESNIQFDNATLQKCTVLVHAIFCFVLSVRG